MESLNLEYIETTVVESFAEQMRHTQQSPLWHAEGDVLTHTLMVMDALHGLPEYHLLNERKQHILTIAALLHDIGKISTSTLVDGEWKAPHHAPIGSGMARKLLWRKYGLCGMEELMQVREAICLLIRYHTFPTHTMDMKNGLLRLHRIAANGSLVPDFSIRMLCLLCRADMLGRKCKDQEQMLEQISLCEELAKQEGCFDRCYPFSSLITRRAFLSGMEVRKDESLEDESWGEVVWVIGASGSGKADWIRRCLPDMPIISIDDTLREQEAASGKAHRAIINKAREQALEYLNRHQSFVWNATNISAQMRETLICLFESYHARVRMVYLETDGKMQLMASMDEEENLLGKMTLPEAYEASRVEWICSALRVDELTDPNQR